LTDSNKAGEKKDRQRKGGAEKQARSKPSWNELEPVFKGGPKLVPRTGRNAAKKGNGGEKKTRKKRGKGKENAHRRDEVASHLNRTRTVEALLGREEGID